MINDGFAFNDAIMRMLLARGFTQFTEAQKGFFPHVMKGENALLISPTGSGKTEAAMVPIFQKLMDEPGDPISVLYVTPLRALNRDMQSRLLDYASHTGITIQLKHSDMTQAERRRVTTHPPSILITTPESLQIMLKGKILRKLLTHVKFVIADELHELSQGERGTQFGLALERLQAIAGSFQRIGLSATVGNAEELAKFLSPHLPAQIVDISTMKQKKLTAFIPEKSGKDASEIMGCDEQYAGSVLRIMSEIETNPGTIVFVNTRTAAEDMAFRIRLISPEESVEVHHGSLSREAREAAERNFKEGKTKALISTSSLELGIDIGAANMVVQFNSPRQVTKLLQRAGRSGHSLERTSLGKVICNDIVELEEAVAIIQLAYENRPESVSIAENSLSTLANQIISEVNASGKINVIEFYNTVKGSYSYRNLSFEEYASLVEFLGGIRKIWHEGDFAGPRRASLNYFISNISMIPSEKVYRVIDVVEKKFIGTLDERYVVSEIEPGSNFIMKGSTWRCSRIDGDRILVEPMFTPAIAPKWSGEDIPVPMEVSMRVGRNRRTGDYSHSAEESVGRLREWAGSNLSTDRAVVIEAEGIECVIQTLLGTKGNYALAGILSVLVSTITGESVEMDYSPYHIYIRCSRRFTAAAYKDMIFSLRGRDLESIVRSACRRSTFFNLVFLYEARKFGIISPESEIGKMRMEKIIESYFETPVYADSIRKLRKDYMNMDTVVDFLDNLEKLSFITLDRLGEGSRQFIRHYSERIMPLKPTRTILESVKKRIMNETVSLYCTSCGNFRTSKVSEIRSIRCPVCGSSLVASLSARERERIKPQDMDSDPALRKWITKNAHLVREKGVQAIMAMAGHGVGVETASRILNTSYIDEEDFVKAILEAETEYAKNRRFWS